MSLVQDVAKAIIRCGPSTLDDMVLLFPSFTRQQVNTAMKNAKQRGWLRVSVRGKGLGGASGGTAPSVYEALVDKPEFRPRKKYAKKGEKPQPQPKVKPERPKARVSAVWDLGSGSPVFSLPGEPGRRFELLGEW